MRPHQLAHHFFDTVHKAVSAQLAALDLQKLRFPFRRQKRRFDIVGQDRNQINALLRGQQQLFLSIYKTCYNELFKDRRTRRRRTQAFSLRVVRRFLHACGLHCRKQGILGIMLWR